jgi:DNA polymerase
VERNGVPLGPPVEEQLPEVLRLESLDAAAATCRACDLYARATQTVFGEGRPGAAVVFVGEQPGDKEDLAGRPFVGPAGQLLDRALGEAGIDRDGTYVTNAVKHFRWTAKGRRRIHDKPDTFQVRACRPWLDAEIAVVRPRVVVALGATAAQAMLGPSFRVTRERGTFREWPPDALITATVHPSSILRAADEATRTHEFDLFVADLGRVAEALSG